MDDISLIILKISIINHNLEDAIDPRNINTPPTQKNIISPESAEEDYRQKSADKNQPLYQQYNDFLTYVNKNHIINSNSFKNLRPNHDHYKYVKTILEVLELRLVNAILDVESLELSGHFITDEDMEIICRAIVSVPNSRITVLNLADNIIEGAGIEYLVSALKNPNCKLTNLNLYRNGNIGDNELKNLSEALVNPNCNLEKLDISDNQIGDAGVQYLIAALKNHNCKLSSLNFTSSLSSTTGLISLAQVLADPNCKLTELNLGTFSSNVFLAICDALEVNKNIIYFESTKPRIKKLIDKNLNNAKDVVKKLTKVFSEQTPIPSSQLLSEFLPRIWAVKSILHETEEGKEIFQKVENFCLKEYQNCLGNIGAIIANQQDYSTEFSISEKGEFILTQQVVKVAIASVQAKEKNFLLARFNKGECPETKEEWNKISINALEEVVKEFLDPKTSSVDQNTKFKTKEERIKFLKSSTIEGHKDYKTHLKPLLEKPKTIISGQTAKQEKTEEKALKF